MNLDLFSSIAKELLSAANPRTPVLHLARKAFTDGGNRYVAIQQNPETGSKWATLARQGHEVVQFKDVNTDKYVAVSVDGTVQPY